MSQQNQMRTSGSYTANLVGNIRSHLAMLQGYDVMALELIQNADDAKAEEIIFDITDEGLSVFNNKNFTLCNDLSQQQCSLKAENNYSCDYHRIIDVGSGNKLIERDNIGRFGIGFVSTYQITNHPEINSSGIKLTLKPEEGKWDSEGIAESNGTTFFLPWADDPTCETRLELGVSHISSTHIDQLTEDLKKVLDKSLLFLRHVRKAEVRRNGNMLLACELHRSYGDKPELIISFKPSGKTQRWHILRTDASEHAASVYEKYPYLEQLDRKTEINIGLQLEPKPLAEGSLYAFLPTEQSTGLPLHINADFFPESDRKTIIFAGNQHEQAWNEMLIDAAAIELARDPENLLQMFGDKLWKILLRSYELFSSPDTHHPTCFNQFWERLKVTATKARIIHTQDGSTQSPGNVFLLENLPSPPQAKAFFEIGGRIVTERLWGYQRVMEQLEAPYLDLKSMVTLLTDAMAGQIHGKGQVTEQKIDNFYRPLWGMVNDLLPIGKPVDRKKPFGDWAAVSNIQNIPFIATEDLFVADINQSYLLPKSIDAGQVATLLPRFGIASHYLHEFPKIAKLVDLLDLDSLSKDIDSNDVSSLYTKEEPAKDISGIDKKALRSLYTLFSDLDRLGDADQAAYKKLRDLPIWLSEQELQEASKVLLPGNFQDPTGEANLLDPSVLTEEAREFVSNKIGIQEQTVEAYVEFVLPRFFKDNGPIDLSKYKSLMTELTKHPSLINNDSLKKLMASFPLIPTQDGNWSTPDETYRKTEYLKNILGDAAHLWLDPTRIPNERSVSTFLDSLGIRSSPGAGHLVARMHNIAESSKPTNDAKKASSEAFYVLCDQYDEWKNKESFQEAIAELAGTQCFPADGEENDWYHAEDLYAPFRAKAFESQAYILDFKLNARLNTDFLEELTISTNPETNLVVGHLLDCVERGVHPHALTYKVLNERANEVEIEKLRDTSCIFVENQNKFIRPNQVYWIAQQLGRYAFTIPESYEQFKELFTAIGVKNAPDPKDYVDILLDIVNESLEQENLIEGKDLAVYQACLNEISKANDTDKLDDSDLERLQKHTTIRNILGRLIFHDELLLHDSEWYAAFFDEELNPALCKLAPELWPLLERIGVRRLSKCAKVELALTGGEEKAENNIPEKLHQHAKAIARLLHDKPTLTRREVVNAFSTLTVVSYDIVQTQATVDLGGNPVNASPASAQAYYDIDALQLILARPLGERSWTPILNALFHQLMPEESGNEISKLTLSISPLMTLSVEEAHRALTDAGIPPLEAEQDYLSGDILTSSELGDIEDTSNSGHEQDEEESNDDAPPEEKSQSELSGESSTSEKTSTENYEGEEHLEGKSQTGLSGKNLTSENSSTEDNEREEHSEEKPEPELNGESSTIQTSQHGNGSASDQEKKLDEQTELTNSSHNRDQSLDGDRTQKTRSGHKEQWDRRLLSYVRRNETRSDENEGQGNILEHNLAVEVIARRAVCTYEKERGRSAEQMAQTHPGYDIISRNPSTSEERFIEVKGVNGEWNQTGVGLSKLQFSNAQDFGDSYWLYVVELVSDLEHIRVHPIQNPAKQVTSFMFDGNWREAVTDERGDPMLSFIEGARVKHQQFGLGLIISRWRKGEIHMLEIEFEASGRQRVALNLHSMKVVDNYEDDEG